MTNKLDALLGFHQTALRVRNQRQEILASNIANADTPNYKARDLDFESAFAQALKQNGASTQSSNTNGMTTNSQPNSGLFATNNAHITNNSTNGSINGEPMYRQTLQGSVDGNTVDMDVERNAYVDNGIRYEASLTMISGQIKNMMTAINGQ